MVSNIASSVKGQVSSHVFSLVYITWQYLHTIAFCYLICQLFVDFAITGIGSRVQDLICRFGLLLKCLVRHSVEDNSRLLSIYMRPWTLNPQDHGDRS